MSGFKELTFVEYDFHNAEVMVDVDVDTKEVIGIYTYEDCIPELFEDAEQEFEVKWQVGKTNSLFHHVTTDLEMAFKALCNEGFVCIGEEEDEQIFISDLYLKYDLGHRIENY
jgi:hypothetical protein